MKYVVDTARAWAADALIRAGWGIAPPHYLERMFTQETQQ